MAAHAELAIDADQEESLRVGSAHERGMLRPDRHDGRARGGMELAQAFEALIGGATGPTAEAAVRAIRECALRFARADARCDRALADDCAQEIFCKLWSRFALGENPVERPGSAACAGYIRTMVQNWLHDRSRADQRASRLRDALEAKPEADDGGESLERRAAWTRALLQKIADRAIAERPARHRHHLEQGWNEIRALVFDEVPLQRLLDDPSVATRDAAYKRHERTREALQKQIEPMEAEGLLTVEEAAAAKLAIRGLARRRRSNREDP